MNTSYTQHIPTTVIPCSLHNVATATRNTVTAIGVQTANKKDVIENVLSYNKTKYLVK